MNTLAIAAALAAILGVTHSWIGERLIIQPVLAAEGFPALRGRHYAWPVFLIIGSIAWLSRN